MAPSSGEARTYGQFCALARALDHVGDRWTLLIVRELLPGPRRFAELQQGLRGVATNLLTERLRSLESDGLVTKAGGRTGAYALTEAGRELEEVVGGLIRWGARWMRSGPGGDAFDPRWALVALQALLPGPAPSAQSGTVELHLEAGALRVRLSRGRRTLLTGRAAKPDAVLEAPAATLLMLADGVLTLQDAMAAGSASVHGSRELAAAAVQPR